MTGGPLDFGPDGPVDRPSAAPSSVPSAPAPSSPPPDRGRGPGFAWVLGGAAVLLAVTFVLSAIGRSDPPAQGAQAGGRLPPFAVPAADGTLEGDANVATPATVGPEAGRRPACEVRGPRIVNVCALAEQGPVVLALVPTDHAACRATLDRLDRLAPAFPQVRFAGVGIGGDRADLRGHRIPVGHDADGAVAAVYGLRLGDLAACPRITFARRGGRVVETTRGALTDAQLRAKVRALVR
jgi:hypothetical protein